MSQQQPAVTINQTIEARYRLLFIVWGAAMASIIMFALLTRLVTQSAEAGSGNATLRWLLPAMGTLTFVLSFMLKQKKLQQAFERQDTALVQVGYLLAFVLCEVTALLGLLYSFVTGWLPSYYFLFGLAEVGMVIHFPNRAHLRSASFKGRGFGAQ